MLRVPVHVPTARPQNDCDALTAEMQRVLAALSEIEARYEGDRECLERWSGPDAIRARFFTHLEAHHAQEREPLVQRLADLHQQITTASMFPRLRGVQH